MVLFLFSDPRNLEEYLRASVQIFCENRNTKHVVPFPILILLVQSLFPENNNEFLISDFLC